MKKMITTIAVAAGLITATFSAANAQQAQRPSVSEKPYQMLQQLKPLLGDWEMVTEITNDNGETWQAMPASEVSVFLKHKDLLLAEVPQDTASGGFHMENYIAYDQYRGVYRKAAVDDVWGVMDLYEGKLEDGNLVLTNLKAGTTFPIADGVWRNFRLTVELKTPTRKIIIDKSDDGGKTWQPAFRVNYTLKTAD